MFNKCKYKQENVKKPNILNQFDNDQILSSTQSACKPPGLQ